MPVALYRRHRRECKSQLPHNLRTSEYDERKKELKRCECPIFASGTLGERFKRDHAAMLPLPAAPYEACEKITGRVSSLSPVRYRSNDYSVPTR